MEGWSLDPDPVQRGRKGGRTGGRIGAGTGSLVAALSDFEVASQKPRASQVERLPIIYS